MGSEFTTTTYALTWHLGKTPAEAAGIDLQLEGNKWNSLIAQSSKYKATKNHDGEVH